MTHLAWVPREWEEVAVETLAGLGERHPSRGILLFPEPTAEDGIDAKVSMLAFPLREQRRHIAAEVIELRLRGLSSRAAASIVNPLLVPGLPVFLRWRGRPPFGEPEADQLIDVCDRLIYDSKRVAGRAAGLRGAAVRAARRARTSPGAGPSRGEACSRGSGRDRRGCAGCTCAGPSPRRRSSPAGSGRGSTGTSSSQHDDGDELDGDRRRRRAVRRCRTSVRPRAISSPPSSTSSARDPVYEAAARRAVG